VSQQRQSGGDKGGRSTTAVDAAAPGAAAGGGTGCEPNRPMMDPERQAEVLLRLAKAAGQVQGISRMVNADRYCVDVLTQIAAAQKALDGVARIVTRNYLERCVTDAINGGDPLIYDELMRVIDRRRG
jgi:CsoR family transcriptional regulator, copper-sensing transcriptional repressor